MDERLTVEDCRDIDFCVPGIRRRCKELNLDFRDFVKNGLPLEEMERLDDAQISRACAVARARIEKG